MIHWKSLPGMDYFAKVRRAEEITPELRWSTLARTTKGPIHNFYTTDFDFAPACPKAALVGAPAMCDQNINEWSKTLQNHPSTASSEGVSETCMSEGGPWKAQVKKSCVYIKEVCASQLSIFRIHCKNWWTLASMFPNCNHLAQPVPTPPDVYTGRTFSASRPIVGVGDRHDVVQSVSNAISEVTICHTVNSPHSDQIPNVVLNMCVWPRFQASLAHKNWNSRVLVVQDFVPRTRPIHASRGTNHATEQFTVCNIKCGQLLFEDFAVARCEACHLGHYCMKECKAIFDRNLVVRKNRAICIENPLRCLQMVL